MYLYYTLYSEQYFSGNLISVVFYYSKYAIRHKKVCKNIFSFNFIFFIDKSNFLNN